MGRRILVGLGVLAALAPLPASAEVVSASEGGFALRHEAVVAASPDAAWAALSRPADWWSAAHSYSGDASNLRLDPVAGACFCEDLPEGSGSVEHMRVVYADPRGHTLRLRGALGPLQAEALTGTLTMTVEPSGSGSKIAWVYVVGGYSRMPMSEWAPLVDSVIGEQLARLAASLGTGD